MCECCVVLPKDASEANGEFLILLECSDSLVLHIEERCYREIAELLTAVKTNPVERRQLSAHSILSACD